MDKELPGVRNAYDTLSEIAHPNWAGVVGLYSKADREKLITYFGRGLVESGANRLMIANLLVGSLGVFEHAYNRISELMPKYLERLESL